MPLAKKIPFEIEIFFEEMIVEFIKLKVDCGIAVKTPFKYVMLVRFG